MQKLLSGRFLSRNTKQTSFSSFQPSRSFISQNAERNPKKLWSPTFPHSTSSTVSHRIFGFFASSAVLNLLKSNTHLQIQSGSCLDGIRLLRARFPTNISPISRAMGLARSYRRSLMPTADNVVLGLIVANVAVFLLWRTEDPIFMLKNFTISLENFTSGRLHTLVTSAFSHKDIGHLMSNMFGLYFFGASIANLFGPEFLLKLYLAGAVSGSIFFLVHKALIASSKDTTPFYSSPSRTPGLGASGAVNAIILLHIFLFPKAIHYVNLFIPVPAALLGAFIIGSDLWRVKQGDSHISGAAHLGGAVVAVLVWARIKKRWI